MSTSPVSVSWATAGMSPLPSHFSSVVMTGTPGSRPEPHGDTAITEIGLGLADGVAAEVEHGGDEQGVGLAFDHARAEMLEASRSSRGDHGDGDCPGHRPRQLEVIAVTGAVAVHAREKDLPRSERLHLARPGDRVTARRPAAAMSEDALAWRRARLALRDDSLCVNSHHDALAAEALRRLADQLGALEGRGIDRDLVGAGAEQGPDVLDAPHAAPHGEGHVDALGRPAHHVEHDLPLLVGGGDVEEDELVGALDVIGARGLHGIARVTEIHEAHTLDYTARVDVEARNETLAEHGASGPPPPRRGDPPPRCRARGRR